LDFNYINDLWIKTTCQQQPLFWVHKDGHCSQVWLYFISLLKVRFKINLFPVEWWTGVQRLCDSISPRNRQRIGRRVRVGRGQVGARQVHEVRRRRPEGLHHPIEEPTTGWTSGMTTTGFLTYRLLLSIWSLYYPDQLLVFNC